MALLFYFHLNSIQKTDATERIRVFADVFRKRLARSCLSLPESPSLSDGSTLSRLVKDYKYYFMHESHRSHADIYRVFLKEAERLLLRDCEGVVVNGHPYDGDGAGCFGRSSRRLALRRFGARESRCMRKKERFPFDVYEIEPDWSVRTQPATERSSHPLALSALRLLGYVCRREGSKP